MANPIVTITMENGDVMKAELYPEIAPNTVNNFISLVKKGFYDGLTFHRIIKGLMIQGGCPLGNGTGNPGYSIKGEFRSNGFDNQLKHEEGVLSMARAMMPDSPLVLSFSSCISRRRIWTASMLLSERSSKVWMWWTESPVRRLSGIPHIINR